MLHSKDVGHRQTKWWQPARTYLRMKYQLTFNNRAPTELDDCAINMAVCPNLFKSAEVRIANKTVSKIDSYFPQIDAMVKRTSKSGIWLNSTGNSEYWQPNMEERRAETASDGKIDYDYNKYFPAVSADDLGFDVVTPNQAAYVTATRVITWTANGGNAIDIIDTTPIRKGDIINGTGGNFAPFKFKVLSVLSLATALVEILEGPAATDVNAETVVNTTYSKQGSSALRKSNLVDVSWSIPLSIFKIQTALPAMSVQLTLQPQDTSSFRKRAIESLLADLAPGVGVDQFNFEVKELNLYIATVNGPRVDNITYYLSLDEVRVQPQNVTPSTTIQQKTYDVSPSTYALAVSFADRAAGVDTRRSASKYKIAPTVLYPEGLELAVDRLFLLYSGGHKPSPDGDWKFDGLNNTFQQVYTETMRYNGMYFQGAGTESFRNYLDRGWYAFYSWPRSGEDRSVRCSVNFKFAENPGQNADVLLFDFSKKTVILQVVASRVIDIIEQDS